MLQTHYESEGFLVEALINSNRPPTGWLSWLTQLVDYRAGGRGFEPRPDQHLGSLNN